MDDATTEIPAEVYEHPADEVPEETLQAIEEERERRLDPANRPDNVEIDNTDREFDTTHGRFTDTEVDEELGPFADPE